MNQAGWRTPFAGLADSLECATPQSFLRCNRPSNLRRSFAFRQISVVRGPGSIALFLPVIGQGLKGGAMRGVDPQDRLEPMGCFIFITQLQEQQANPKAQVYVLGFLEKLSLEFNQLSQFRLVVLQTLVIFLGFVIALQSAQGQDKKVQDLLVIRGGGFGFEKPGKRFIWRLRLLYLRSKQECSGIVFSLGQEVVQEGSGGLDFPQRIPAIGER